MNMGLLMAGLLGATGVAAGAFGAHALDDLVTAERLSVWETAAYYHLIHSAVVLVLALQQHQALWRWPIMGFVIGVCLFSFSLYLLVLTGISTLAMITPIGGLLLIISWLGVAFRARRFSS
ncbi:DUF423 domain-containing protein [Luminiphilus sp.]|nr:DUF423 domain-containing protein [Luminiphilus sp.]